MGGLFSGSLYFGYQNYLEMKELFGVSNHALVSTSNPIDFLNGVEGSPFEGMSFNGSNQLYNWYIDDLEPALGAIIPFYENDYGNVSIMYDGCATYGHKTFYFSYALAELIDESPPNRRDTLLNRIFKFLDLYDPVADFMADTTLLQFKEIPSILLINLTMSLHPGNGYLKVVHLKCQMSRIL